MSTLFKRKPKQEQKEESKAQPQPKKSKAIIALEKRFQKYTKVVDDWSDKETDLLKPIDVPMDLVHQLVDGGGDLDITTAKHGISLLEVAIAHAGVEDKNLAMVERIAKKAPQLVNKVLADKRDKPEKLHSAMHTVAQMGRLEIMQVLIANGGNVNLTLGKDGETPLHVAGSSDMAQLLLNKGAKVDAVTKDGFTSLMKLVISSDIERKEEDVLKHTKVLLSNDTDVSISHSKHADIFRMAGNRELLAPYRFSLFGNNAAGIIANQTIRDRAGEIIKTTQQTIEQYPTQKIELIVEGLYSVFPKGVVGIVAQFSMNSNLLKAKHYLREGLIGKAGSSQAGELKDFSKADIELALTGVSGAVQKWVDKQGSVEVPETERKR